MRHEPFERGVSEQMREYPAFTEIYEHDHTVVEEYPDHSLMLIWPTYHEDWPGKTLESWEGDTLIYVGEGKDQATGDTWFHEQIETEWTLLESIQIPT